MTKRRLIFVLMSIGLLTLTAQASWVCEVTRVTNSHNDAHWVHLSVELDIDDEVFVGNPSAQVSALKQAFERHPDVNAFQQENRNKTYDRGDPDVFEPRPKALQVGEAVVCQDWSDMERPSMEFFKVSGVDPLRLSHSASYRQGRK